MVRIGITQQQGAKNDHRVQWRVTKWANKELGRVNNKRRTVQNAGMKLTEDGGSGTVFSPRSVASTKQLKWASHQRVTFAEHFVKSVQLRQTIKNERKLFHGIQGEAQAWKEAYQQYTSEYKQQQRKLRKAMKEQKKNKDQAQVQKEVQLTSAESQQVNKHK